MNIKQKDNMRLSDLFTCGMIPNWKIFNDAFPEMSTCNHSFRWHKEGTPLEHTKFVTMEMHGKPTNESEVINVDPEKYLILMSAAMLHDIGKPSTTYWNKDKEDLCCCSHGKAGERLFRNLFFEERIDLREKVAYMICNHMTLHHICDDNGNVNEEK